MKTSIKTITIVITFLITSNFALAQNRTTGTTSTNSVERPDKRAGESDAAYTSRLRAWEKEARKINTANPETSTSVSRLPERPVKRTGESDDAYGARIRAWEAEVRRIASGTPKMPARPEKRAGESDANYNARLRAWETEVRRLTIAANPKVSTTSPGSSEIEKLKQQLKELQLLVSKPGFGTSEGLDNTLVIPTEGMTTEGLLNVNEDMNIMSQIFRSELIRKGIASPPVGGLFSAATEYSVTNLGLAADDIKSMYLQGYGALFLIKMDFPLMSLPETPEQPQEPNKGEVDQVWQQTKQMIYEQGVVSVNPSVNQQVKYDTQKVENLKNTLITALKHATNIRAIKPDEAVIIRTIGIGQSIRVLSVKKEENQSLIFYESNGVKHSAITSDDLNDFIKSLSTPTAIIIRAKKSDIDAFAKGELDFDKFREKVQVFSYPLM